MADASDDVNTARAEPPDVEPIAPVAAAAAAAGTVGATVPETVVSLTKGLAVSVLWFVMGLIVNTQFAEGPVYVFGPPRLTALFVSAGLAPQGEEAEDVAPETLVVPFELFTVTPDTPPLLVLLEDEEPPDEEPDDDEDEEGGACWPTLRTRVPRVCGVVSMNVMTGPETTIELSCWVTSVSRGVEELVTKIATGPVTLEGTVHVWKGTTVAWEAPPTIIWQKRLLVSPEMAVELSWIWLPWLKGALPMVRGALPWMPRLQPEMNCPAVAKIDSGVRAISNG